MTHLGPWAQGPDMAQMALLPRLTTRTQAKMAHLAMALGPGPGAPGYGPNGPFTEADY